MLTEFAASHPDAAIPLDNWYRRARRASWRNLDETRIDYPHADPVGTCTVFNIAGNKYRLIVKINYRRQAVYTRFVLTHAEYDKEKWKHDCGC
jgi:mRNA interferase HigB